MSTAKLYVSQYIMQTMATKATTEVWKVVPNGLMNEEMW